QELATQLPARRDHGSPMAITCQLRVYDLRSQLQSHLGHQLVGQGWVVCGDPLVGILRRELHDPLTQQLADRGQSGPQGELASLLARRLHGVWPLRLWPAAFSGGQEGAWLASFDLAEHTGIRFGPRSTAQLAACRAYALGCGWLYPCDRVAFVS